MMTGETETIFHSEEKDVFNSPLAVSVCALVRQHLEKDEQK
jgi:hypothetical protein